MSLVDLSEAQERAGDTVTQDQLDEVEDEWTRRLGPLTGFRIETFFLSEAREPRWNIDGLWLSRRTDNVTVTNSSIGGDTDTLVVGTDFRLIQNSLVELIPQGASWLDTIAVQYEPNDEELVRSVIFDTLIYRQTPLGIQSIRIGAYSETYFPAGSSAKQESDPVMDALARRVLTHAGLGIFGGPFRYRSARRDRTLIVGAGS